MGVTHSSCYKLLVLHMIHSIAGIILAQIPLACSTAYNLMLQVMKSCTRLQLEYMIMGNTAAITMLSARVQQLFNHVTVCRVAYRVLLQGGMQMHAKGTWVQEYTQQILMQFWMDKNHCAQSQSNNYAVLCYCVIYPISCQVICPCIKPWYWVCVVLVGGGGMVFVDNVMT